MTQGDHYSPGNLITVIVPMSCRKRGGRKLLIAPHNQAINTPQSAKRPDDSIIKALARAHRWKKMLERGEFATVEDLAAAEKINPSYLARVLRLTLLAPVIVETIMTDSHSILPLGSLLKPFPYDWDSQLVAFQIKGPDHETTRKLGEENEIQQ